MADSAHSTPTPPIPAAGAVASAPRGPLLDPGWLFLLAGIAVLAATILLPARNDLEIARYYLTRALAIEQHRLDRLGNYTGFLDSIDRADEGTILALAAMQLNQGPAGHVLLAPQPDPRTTSAPVFAQLEPPALVLPERVIEPSRLERWCLADTPRLILTAVGAMCVLIGLLPPTTPRA